MSKITVSLMLRSIFSVLCMLALVACTTSSAKRLSADSLTDDDDRPDLALAFNADPEFAKSLNKVDRAILKETEQDALDRGEAGKLIQWQGKSSGIGGTVLVSQLFRVGQSSCRRLEHKVTTVDGPANFAGTACRSNGQAWRIVR